MGGGIETGECELENRPRPDRLRAVMDTVEEGIVVFDAALAVLEVNQAAERILGRARRQLVGRDRRAARIRLFREDGRPWREADALLDAVAIGGAPIMHLACRVLRPDRSFADVVVNARQAAWSGPDQLDLLLTMTDVTARRRAEIASREGEERMRAIVDGALDALVAVDAQGAIIEFNAAAEGMFGCPRQEMLGRPFEDLMSERDRDANRLLRARFLANPSRGLDRRGLRGLGRRRDGEEFPVEVSMTSFVQAGRRVLSVALRDLTDHDRAESASRESEAKSRFMGAITHELRTPLNSILGFGQLLGRPESGVLNERQRRYLDHVLGSGRHLLGMIDQILDLSRLGAGELVLETEDFDLAVICREVAGRFQGELAAKSIELELDMQPGLVVRGDRLRTAQILHSLLSNAVKFTGGEGRVAVTAERAGPGILVSVADTGIGIPNNRLEEIFGDFTQLDPERTRSYEGAGLGLAVSRRLADAMRGSLMVESKLGQGSTFTLSLPAA